MKPYLTLPGDDDLFAHARRTDPGTSKDAAASVKKITEAHRHILDVLITWGAQTDEEIYNHLNHLRLANFIKISESGARTRRKELVDQAEILDTGERKLTKSGRKTIVWAIRD